MADPRECIKTYRSSPEVPAPIKPFLLTRTPHQRSDIFADPTSSPPHIIFFPSSKIGGPKMQPIIPTTKPAVPNEEDEVLVDAGMFKPLCCHEAHTKPHIASRRNLVPVYHRIILPTVRQLSFIPDLETKPQKPKPKKTVWLCSCRNTVMSAVLERILFGV